MKYEPQFSVMQLIEEIEGSAAPVKLSKWNTSNLTAHLCSRIGKGAKTTMDYIDGFKYGSSNAQNVPGRSNYTCFQLSSAHDIDFDDILKEINARLPELHKTNKLFKAFSNCKNYVVAGVLMRLHCKHIRTDDLEVVFSRGSGIQLGLFSWNLEQWKPEAGKTSDMARPVQAVHIECDAKVASKLI